MRLSHRGGTAGHKHCVDCLGNCAYHLTYADFNRPHSTVFYLFAKTNQSYSNPLKSRLPCDHAHADDRFVPSLDRDGLTCVADPLFLPHLTNSPALNEAARWRGCYRKMNADA